MYFIHIIFLQITYLTIHQLTHARARLILYCVFYRIPENHRKRPS